MSSAGMTRLGGTAAIVGGALWVVKGGVILLGGNQPGLTFELGLLGFALGLVGLHARLNGRGGRPAALGAVVAWLAVAAAVVNVIGDGVAFTDAIAGLGWLAGAVLLGLVTLRTKALPPRWRVLPLAIGLAPPLLLGTAMLAVLALSPFADPDAVEDRAIEVPVVLIGLAWASLGYRLVMGDRAARMRPA